MAQDIRKLLQKQTEKTPTLTKGHESRFEARLAEAFSDEGNLKNKSSFPWMKLSVAALLVVALGLFMFSGLGNDDLLDGTSVANTSDEVQDVIEVKKSITLADISPDLEKIENFYLTGINVQLASLDFNEENQELIDGYMQRLGDLDEAYQQLNNELTQVGPTEATIAALIDNLKLRLELLFKLKNKLQELKLQTNEQFNSIQS